MARLSLQQVVLLALLGAIICSSNIFQFGAARAQGSGEDAEGLDRQECLAKNGTCRLLPCRANEEQMGGCDVLRCCVRKDNSTSTTTPPPPAARG